MEPIYLECDKEEFYEDSVGEKYNDYTLDDCVLVRTTDAFPFDKIVETPVHGVAVEYDKSYILGSEIDNRIRAKYPKLAFDENQQKQFYEELEAFNVAFKSYRPTIHFTINGLVSSHMYGDFSGRPYIIIEPLKYHIQDKSLISLDACDTYFNDDMYLSEEAVILIEKEKYEAIKDNPDYKEDLSKMRYYVYSGNQKQAVSIVLEKLGYDSFIVNNHGYSNGLDSNTGAGKMWILLQNLRQEYGLEAITHFGSDYMYDETNEISKNAEKTDLDHLIYLIDSAKEDGLLEDEFVAKIKSAIEIDQENEISYADKFFESYYGEEILYPNNYSKVSRLIPTLIDKIGLDNIKKYTKDYNEYFINKLYENSNKKRQ